MRTRTVCSVAWLLLVMAGACVTRPDERREPEPFPGRPQPEPRPRRDRAAPPLAPTAARPHDGLAQLLLDGPVAGCLRFAVIAADRSDTRFLILRVAADELKLKPGAHELAIDGRWVAAEFWVFASATTVPPCTQARLRSERLQRWTAVSGTVRLSWTDEPAAGKPLLLDVEIVDVELREDDGRTQRISTRMHDVVVGTKPSARGKAPMLSRAAARDPARWLRP